METSPHRAVLHSSPEPFTNMLKWFSGKKIVIEYNAILFMGGGGGGVKGGGGGGGESRGGGGGGAKERLKEGKSG